MALHEIDLELHARGTRSDDGALNLALDPGSEARVFEEVCRRYRRAIFDLILRSVRDRDRAEDLTQEVFIKWFVNIEKFDSQRQIWPWLATIARRVCIDEARRSRRAAHVRFDDFRDHEFDEALPSALDEAIFNEEQAHLRAELAKALRSLRSRDRRLLLLRFVAGWSYEEIADDDAVSINAVRNVIWRARLSLQVRLESVYRGWQLPIVAFVWMRGKWTSAKKRVHGRLYGRLYGGWRSVGSTVVATGPSFHTLGNLLAGALIAVGSLAAPLQVQSTSIATSVERAAEQSTLNPVVQLESSLHRTTSQIIDSGPRVIARGGFGPTKKNHVAPSSAQMRLELVGPDGSTLYWRETDVQCGSQGAQALPQDGPIRAVC